MSKFVYYAFSGNFKTIRLVLIVGTGTFFTTALLDLEINGQFVDTTVILLLFFYFKMDGSIKLIWLIVLYRGKG